ncbi:hypothetical protein [Endozoicomonas sp. ALB122]|uniref:hypothetical protein n=1 Tax=Endozoicomonas sp. ALB122 TaxID=3403075 RepID=UPI003BB65E27
MDSRLRGNDENEAGNDENEAGNDENEAGNDGSQLVPTLERVFRHPQSMGTSCIFGLEVKRSREFKKVINLCGHKKLFW